MTEDKDLKKEHVDIVLDEVDISYDDLLEESFEKLDEELHEKVQAKSEPIQILPGTSISTSSRFFNRSMLFLVVVASIGNLFLYFSTPVTVSKEQARNQTEVDIDKIAASHRGKIVARALAGLADSLAPHYGSDLSQIVEKNSEAFEKALEETGEDAALLEWWKAH